MSSASKWYEGPCEDVTSLKEQVLRKDGRGTDTDPSGTPVENLHGKDVDPAMSAGRIIPLGMKQAIIMLGQ